MRVKIKMLKAAAGPNGNFDPRASNVRPPVPGVYMMDADLARAFQKAGACEILDFETATEEPQEAEETTEEPQEAEETREEPQETEEPEPEQQPQGNKQRGRKNRQYRPGNK